MTLPLCLAILLALCSFGHSQDFQEDVRRWLEHIVKTVDLMQEDQTQLKNNVDRMRKELNDHTVKAETAFTNIEIVKAEQMLVKKNLMDHSDNAESSFSTMTSKTQDVKELLEGVKVDVAGLEEDHNVMKPVKVSRDCQDVYKSGGKVSGIYRISLDGFKTRNVYCENDKFGGGWTVIQRRIDGSVSFNKTWQSYSAGFGSVDGEHWLGTENIYQLTKTKDKHLKIEIVYKDSGVTHYADYSTFWLQSAAEYYQLFIYGFSSISITFDAMTYNSMRPFSTVHQERDQCRNSNCAKDLGGGWWYGCCTYSHLNGLYGTKLEWYDGSSYQALSAVRMMVK